MLLTAVAAAWVLGLALALPRPLPPASLALFALAFVSLALYLRLWFRRGHASAARSLWLLPLLLAALALGVLRGETSRVQPAAPDVATLNGEGPVGVRGRVVADPDHSGSAYRLRLEVEAIELEGRWQEASGRLLARVRPSQELIAARGEPYLRYGDRLLLRGRVEEPPALLGFDYPEYLARQGIRSVTDYPSVRLLEEGSGPRAWLFALRHRLARALQGALPEPQASLAVALLLGPRGDIPPEIRDAFVATGTAHILAISGQQVAILLGILLGATRAVFGGRRLALLLPFAGIWLYSLLTGMEPPVARAAIMGTILLLARLLGREGSSLPALAATAAAMLGLDPRLLGDVSFQLSFAAVAGMAVLAEPLEGWLHSIVARRLGEGSPLLGPARAVAAALATSVAATAGILPLLAFHFQRLSLVGVPATLLTLPALPLVIVVGGAAAVLGLLSPVLALPLGWLTWLPVAYLLKVVELVARLPGIVVTTGVLGVPLLWGYYGVLALLAFRDPLRAEARVLPAVISRVLRSGPRPLFPLRWAFPAVGAMAVLLWGAAFSWPDGRLHVVFLDVGQGDAILLQTPSGRQVLVDGGPDPRRLARALGSRLPFWDRGLDLVVLTHPHRDHIAGLNEALLRYRVGMALDPQLRYASAEYQEWQELLGKEDIPVVQAVVGQELALGDGVVLQVLHPGEQLLQGTSEDVDNNSVVLMVRYGEVRFLLAGEIHREAEEYLLAASGAEGGGRPPLGATVLKVAHHGSQTSSSPEFIRAVAPAFAVISVGEGNPFGHPHPATLETLRRLLPPEHILLTSSRGTIQFTTDGARLWLSTERQGGSLAPGGGVR
ncbi:MAG: DNA internalization-related competence protein ComEC/Rec2 [Chloroflexi bacterium]|nr:DNA internalization-related competence protein ComEC/Rec2 [Chloroflexota bacterium]